MKRLMCLLLCVLLTLTCVACDGRRPGTPSDAGTEYSSPASSLPEESLPEDTTNKDAAENTTTASQTTTTTTTRKNEFDRLDDKLKEDGYKVEENENDDGSISVELTPPEDDVSPAIPTGPAIPTMPTTKKTTTTTTTTTTKGTTVSTGKPGSSTSTTVTTSTTTTTTTKKPTTTYQYTTGQTHTVVPFTERYMYTTLNAEQQGWYRTIDRAVRNLEERATFSAKLSENRNYYVYFAYMFDNPELWYLGNTLTVYSLGDGTSQIVFCYSDFDRYCSYGHTPSVIDDALRTSIRAKDAIFKKAVNDIVSTIPANAPAVVKEKLIYDRILRTSHYNLGARWNGISEPNWCAYGILVNHYGVCESYSEAFQTLCLQVGINCTGIVGDAGGGHKWNAVKLDGEWYACDITFDDPVGNASDDPYHYYFNRTTKEMEEMNHSTAGSDYPGPQCNGTKYSYANYFGDNYFE